MINPKCNLNTNKFLAAHGKLPRGEGNWAFCPAEHYDANDYIDHCIWFQGRYSDAVRHAFKQLSNKTAEIIVCS